jgi:dihydrofolate synthase/folylpolyglutamate synthase
VTDGAQTRPDSATQFGVPSDDPLAARLFPALAGEVKWGLDRTGRMLASLGDPHRAYPVLHVAGTNGKGSVARIWASILRAAGLRTGLYTSPHLISFRERILVNGTPIPDEQLEEWSWDLRPLLFRERPSFFEAATTLAFLAFAREEVEVAVVEVGMGGRLDATNVVEPVVAAITNVGLDHVPILGGTLEDIAKEKAGILKPGVPVFTADDKPEVLAVLAREAANSEALLHRVRPPEGETTLDGSSFLLRTKRWGDLDLTSPLVGAHQICNLALAVRSLEALPPRLPVSAQAVREGVAKARVPGRFQVEREGDLTWILDVAHNPDGVRALVNALHATNPPRPWIGVVGILSDKPADEMLGSLAAALDSVVLTTPTSAPKGRRWDPAAAAGRLASGRAELRPNVPAAVELARGAAGPSGTVVVTGSSYTVGEAMVALGRIPPEALPAPFRAG